MQCGLKRKQRDYIPRVGMEHLLIRCISGTSDNAVVNRAAEVFDVGEHHVCRGAVVFVVLPASLSGYVGGYTGVNDDVFFSRVFVDLEAAEDEESVSAV